MEESGKQVLHQETHGERKKVHHENGFGAAEGTCTPPEERLPLRG